MTVRDVLAAEADPEADDSYGLTARRALGYLTPHKLALLAAGFCMLIQTLLGLALANGLVGLVRAWIVLRMTNQISANLRRQLVGALLGQSISYFTGARGGELMSRLLNDVAVVESVLGDTALGLLLIMRALPHVTGSACWVCLHAGSQRHRARTAMW